ncbi:hypothetical protein DFP80_1257 [Marinomonas rhizomae]|uniref:Uncharacterized protein n=2 Tax=Marinomonas rhizomae TaxID=491948 RepID=A0A366IVM6_9GAMM|nr:hypothetical protein DFP80_1257 [Marinomonas rhizomae]
MRFSMRKLKASNDGLSELPRLIFVSCFLKIGFPMSDLAAQYDDGVFEPDEETLISALRNQDDIPILMDIVAERDSLSSSQEVHLEQSFSEYKEPVEECQNVIDSSDSHEASLNASKDPSLDDVVTLDNVVAESALSQELIAKTIADVLEKRLPELVSEVMQALQATETAQKE